MFIIFIAKYDFVRNCQKTLVNLTPYKGSDAKKIITGAAGYIKII